MFNMTHKCHLFVNKQNFKMFNNMWTQLGSYNCRMFMTMITIFILNSKLISSKDVSLKKKQQNKQ